VSGDLRIVINSSTAAIEDRAGQPPHIRPEFQFNHCDVGFGVVLSWSNRRAIMSRLAKSCRGLGKVEALISYSSRDRVA